MLVSGDGSPAETRQRAGDGAVDQRLTDSRLANLGARSLRDGLDLYRTRFRDITRRAAERFAARDWAGMATDAGERLDVYRQAVDRVEADTRTLLGDRAQDPIVYASMKAVYSGLIADRDDWELAETFFNSVTRRIFATVGVDPRMEFVSSDFDAPPTPARRPVTRELEIGDDLVGVLDRLLATSPIRAPFADRAGDAARVASVIGAHCAATEPGSRPERLEAVDSVFYRGQAAYIIGRIVHGTRATPVVLALLHPNGGVRVDAVLLDEDSVSILFSFAYSYFHVEVARTWELVRFLKSIVPKKRVAELYIALGFNKHGKTELYRNLFEHLRTSESQFEVAPGHPGLVMFVFTLPDFDVVFKVIRDRFSMPKRTDRKAVMDKYHFVFMHDRAGRLVDAQEFEHVKIERRRFAVEVLSELEREASRSVLIDSEWVVLKHVYVERRVVPLDLYVRQAEPHAARAAVIDWGRAIRDLAAAGIFPGDMLLKNFGVTRHGRVVFYDYDELTWLGSVQFRRLPIPHTIEDELSDEPWFAPAETDVFPEEFRRFLGLPEELATEFCAHHSDLFGVDFWHDLQSRLAAGELPYIPPYEPSHQLGSPGA